MIAAVDGNGGGSARGADRWPAPTAVLDRYLLLERLGSGGFGEVWRAQDELLRRQVAVKRIPCAVEGMAERAAREAHAAARLSHPAIVALYEAAEQNGDFYLISELVQGATLARLIAQDALGDREILEIGHALCGALAHAHARGVIHRDVKPQNILVGEGGFDRSAAAKLADFGGARLAGEEALTHTGDVIGTLAYMAPEQSEGSQAGPESDLYSLALVLYEALSGENPVRAATPAATVRRIGAELPSLRRLRRDLPRVLTTAIDRALRPRPDDRGTLEDLSLALSSGGGETIGWEPGEEAVNEAATPPGRGASLYAEADDPIGSARTSIGALGGSTPHALGGAALAGPLEAPAPRRPLPTLPRIAWLAIAVALLVWQAAAGRPGIALLIAAGALPLLVAMPRRSSPAWLAPALAPLLGLAGLASAFPAFAGRPVASARMRGCLGALGYWWLCLAEIGLQHRLAPAVAFSTGLSATDRATGSASRFASPGDGHSLAAAAHALASLLGPAALCGAALWAAGTIALPWIVRGRQLAVELPLAGVWSASLLVSPMLLGAALRTGVLAASTPPPAVLGAALGALLAVALARAARRRAAAPLK
jgi:eukaryotic-like serine/threonine-protein kinase